MIDAQRDARPMEGRAHGPVAVAAGLALVVVMASIVACQDGVGEIDPETVAEGPVLVAGPTGVAMPVESGEQATPLAASTGLGEAPATTLAPLGANLPAVNDWMYTPVYADLVHQARRFGSPSAPWDEAAILGDDGWPRGDFGVVLSTGLAGYARSAGTYKLLFDGKARIDVVASNARVENVAWDGATGRTRADIVVAPGATQLFLAFTRTGAGIRNLRVVRPGFDPLNAPLYTPEFLRHVARFRTLRFMDWLHTNGSPVTRWSTRAVPATTHHASAAGVPWEHVVALANAAGKDIWINVPIGADDDYVLQLARLLKSTLDPASVIYVEYSNEIWNPSFPQFATNRQLALAQVHADPGSPLVRDGTTNPDVIALRHVGERLVRIADIFRSVWGDAAMMKRIRPVLAAQIAQPFVSETILAYVAAMHGPPSRYFWALAGAPYFNLGGQQTVEGLGVDDVLAAMSRSIEAIARTNHFEVNLAQASWYALPLVAYEGGSDTFGPGSLAAKKAASLDPRMLAICSDYLSTWFSAGGGLMLWFTAGAGNWDTPYGTWELTTDLAVEETPKTRCLDTALAAGIPPVRARIVAPGTFDALAFAGNDPPYSAESMHRLRYLHPGDHVDYLVYAPRRGSYALKIRAAAKVAGNSIDVMLNGESIARRLPLAAAGWESPQDNGPVALPLRAGFNTLRLVTRDEAPVEGGFALLSLAIASSAR